tara:strand:+ start:169 stop:648 length:480 start_codon:yes stop_codon:yes gene_type:complete
MKEIKMSRTTFSGPIKAGTIANNTYKNLGFVQMVQAISFTENVTTSKTIYLPAGSKITNISFITSTGYTATTAGVTVGNVAAGTQYAASSSALSAANASATPTTLWPVTPTSLSSADTGTAPVSTIVATLTLGTPVTAGITDVIVEYTQPDDRNTAFTA